VIVLASPAASQVVPGILGFLVVAGMALALFFLLRSMNKQLNKVAREPRWREEAKQAQQDQAQQDQAERDQAERDQAERDQAERDQAQRDYSQNGTAQQG
jgi:flagellar biosynthesis component FlhA